MISKKLGGLQEKLWKVWRLSHTAPSENVRRLSGAQCLKVTLS